MSDLSDFKARSLPGAQTLGGRLVTLEPFDTATHGASLARAIAGPENAGLWTFMPFGPFQDKSTFPQILADKAKSQNWATYVILDQQAGNALGTASYMRQRPEHGSLEIGCVAFGERLKKTAHASEAVYLMAAHVFNQLGYRRFEWKCHNENAASKKAATRFGFRFEGIFRNDMVMKGKNRDTAWFAMTDDDWPTIEQGYQAWLHPENFDSSGKQKTRLVTSVLTYQQQAQQQQ